ncbi:MAG: PrpF domain-containing protein [Devosia sp.]
MAIRYPAAFIRGGTSKAIVFQVGDLPLDRNDWDAIFLRAMGSPDRYGRQLNGMGGGISSLSKVCIVGSSSVPDADVDYTFAQVQIQDAKVDYSGNCGNMSSAIGPYAIDQGLLPAPSGEEACVRIHNTNTHKIIHATFPIRHGKSVEEGDLSIPGVDGTGAPVRLDFLTPGGASTRKLLPSGAVTDVLDVPGIGAFTVSLIDAANACVFVDAAALGLSGTESPEDLGAQHEILQILGELRLRGSVAMGIASSLEAAASIRMIPFVALVTSARESQTFDREVIPADNVDLVVRMLSNGQPHKALPLTGALCTAVAMQMEGSIPNQLARKNRDSRALRLGMPSGVLIVAADVGRSPDGWHAKSGSFFRTTRRLFDGHVYA